MLPSYKYCELCRKEGFLPESCIYEYGNCDFCGQRSTLHVVPQEYVPCSALDVVEKSRLKYNRRGH